MNCNCVSLGTKNVFSEITRGPETSFPLHLRAGEREIVVAARVDPMDEVNLISPQQAGELQALIIGTVELLVDGQKFTVAPLVRLDVNIGQKVIQAQAAVTDLVRERTGKHFSAGCDIFLAAKDAGVLMFE